MAWILALVSGSKQSRCVAKVAIDLGLRLTAHVELLHVEVDPQEAVPILGEGMSGVVVEEMIQSMQREASLRLKEARRVFDSCRTDTGLTLVEADEPGSGQGTLAFRHIVGREPEEVERRGRLCDLIVLERPYEHEKASQLGSLDAALFGTARPVCLVPPDFDGSLGQCVAVAWDSSREAALAVRCALPILRKAERVVVLTARGHDEAPEPSALVRYFATNNVNAKTWAFTPSDRGVGGDLLEETVKAGADSLVMGGYGHSRIREMLLGGATRTVLREASLPVIMAH